MSFASAGIPPERFKPWLTYCILLTLVGIYTCELVFAINPSGLTPSVQTLIALGGLNRTVILSSHEWHRFFTGPLLHGNLLHILFNGVALFFAGSFLEKQIGRFWYLAFYILGAIGGSCMSYAANPPDVTSVGASGALMALCGAAFTSSFRLPQGTQRRWVQVESVRVLLPSLLPMFSAGGGHIDFRAHIGGALTGVLLGGILLRFWPEGSPLPPYRRYAACIAGLGLALVVASVGLVIKHYPEHVRSLALLIPDKEIPKSKDAIMSKSADLVRHYPHDPRAHVFRAEALLTEHNPISARYELEAGLKEAENYRFLYGQKMANTIRIMLAAIWIDSGAPYEAEKVLKPVCHTAPFDRPDSKTYQFVIDHQLCK